jgi:two-component system LytT family sensor kinase
MKKIVRAVLHFAYWSMYLFIILYVLVLLKETNQTSISARSLFLSQLTLAAILPGLIGFYSFYFVLFRKYLSTKKILQLVLSSLAISVTASIFTQLVLFTLFPNAATRINWNLDTCIFMGLFLAFITLVHGVLGLVMKGFITWYGDIKLKAELNKKNYEMELALMKAQVNPHFLFNTINNIDALIRTDAATASQYLNQLSDILRFMIYETKTEKILLEKEISYIEKYIGLQKIRTSNPSYISWEVGGDPGDIVIEPMMFIPFIENAFKHAENKKAQNAIVVKLIIEKDKVTFECKNSYSSEIQIKPEHSGLGNELIERRLALLYPEKHNLSVVNNNGKYKVTLTLLL